MSFVPPPSPESTDPFEMPRSERDEDQPRQPFFGEKARGRPFPLHPHFGWAILWCIAMLLITMTPGIIAALGYILFVVIFFPGSIDRSQMSLDNVHIQIGLGLGIWVPHVCIILLSLIVLRIAVGRNWTREIALRLPSFSHIGLVVVLTPAIMILANAVMTLLRDKLGWPTIFDPKKMEGLGDIEQLFNSWPLAIAVFVIGFMPGISDELWCRGFLGRGLVVIHGYVLGVLMTSFFFGLIHLDPCQGTMAALMGIILHYVYLTTRSLVAPMLLHFFNNSMSVILARLPEAANFEPKGSSEVFIYFAAGLVLVAVAYALYESRARLVAKDGGVPWQPPYPGVACPPAGSNTIVVAPTPSLIAVFMVFLSLAVFGAVLTVVVTKGLDQFH